MPDSSFTIHITIEQQNERSFALHTSSDTTVLQLKQTIEQTQHIPTSSQQLIYMGRFLDDDSKPLSFYSVCEGCTVLLSIRQNVEEGAKMKYVFVSERERLVSRLQESAHSLTFSGIGWMRVLSMSGARLPEGGDQLSYPSGTVLEPLRQGLLTYNTYVSALDLPAASLPAVARVGVEGSAQHANDRVWYVGEWLDALDTVNNWLEATVYAVDGEFVMVHYNGWSSRWDEWIHRNSSRLAPFRTHTYFVPARSNLSPDAISWSALAEPTGEDDARAVVEEVGRVSLSLWNAIASTRREEGESEEAWEDRRKKAYRELAPLLDRVGRLSVDVASLLQFEGNGGVIERVPVERRARALPQLARPPLPATPPNARVGMDSLVRGVSGSSWSLLPLSETQDRAVVIRGDEMHLRREDMEEMLNQLVSSIQRQADHVNVTPENGRRDADSEHTHADEHTEHILSTSVNGEESRPPSLL